MRRMRGLLLLSLCTPLAGLVPAGPGKDQIKLENAGKSVKGVLVDGLLAGQSVNDLAFTSIDAGNFFKSLFPNVVVDNLGSSELSNEVIGFSTGHPPRLAENVPWTDAVNTVRLEFEDMYGIRVVVWMVYGPFDRQSQLAIDANLATSLVWVNERQGIAFDSYDILDATGDPDAPQMFDFTCGLSASITSKIGFEAGAINVYYVRNVNFGTGFGPSSGVWCGSGVIAMGWLTSPVLLAHEIGHAFGLQHIDGFPGSFDTTNVMHPSSSNRRFLTEGQTFRAVFDPASAINSIYELRPNEIIRSCPTSTSTTDPDCPAIQKRIWEDGPGWGPN